MKRTAFWISHKLSITRLILLHWLLESQSLALLFHGLKPSRDYPTLNQPSISNLRHTFKKTFSEKEDWLFLLRNFTTALSPREFHILTAAILLENQLRDRHHGKTAILWQSLILNKATLIELLTCKASKLNKNGFQWSCISCHRIVCTKASELRARL